MSLPHASPSMGTSRIPSFKVLQNKIKVNSPIPLANKETFTGLKIFCIPPDLGTVQRPHIQAAEEPPDV